MPKMKYIVISLTIFISALIMSFAFPQDSRNNSPHHTLKNADIVISIKVDSVTPEGLLLISSIASIDTSSEYSTVSYDMLQFVAKNGPGTVKFVDGKRIPTPIDSLKRDKRNY